MAQGTKFTSFKEFWPEYLRLHSKPITRGVHFAGTLGGIALATVGIITGASALIIAAPFVIYGILIPSHPIFEKNIPATAKNPIMSIGGDFKLLFCWLSGNLRKEYEKHGLDYSGKTGNNQNDPNAVRIAKPAAASGPSVFAGMKSKLGQAFNKLKAGANDNAAPKAPSAKNQDVPKI